VGAIPAACAQEAWPGFPLADGVARSGASHCMANRLVVEPVCPSACGPCEMGLACAKLSTQAKAPRVTSAIARQIRR